VLGINKTAFSNYDRRTSKSKLAKSANGDNDELATLVNNYGLGASTRNVEKRIVSLFLVNFITVACLFMIYLKSNYAAK
jgi:hypothetical protein